MTPEVFIVDDDDAVRDAVAFLLRSNGRVVRSHASAQAFLQAFSPVDSGCLILDLHMPDMNGVDLLEYMNQHDIHLPVIVITAYSDNPLVEQAVQSGCPLRQIHGNLRGRVF